MPTIRLVPSALVVLVAMSGCTVSDDEATSMESTNEAIVRPKGKDAPGSLLVSIPAGSSAAAGLSMAFNDVRLTPGVAADVAATNGCLTVREIKETAQTYYARDCNVTTTAGKTTIYTLGEVRETPPTTNTFGWSTDGATPSTAPVWNAEGTLTATIKGGNGLRLPGTYRVQFGFWDGFKVTVSEGQSIHVDYSDISHRRTARLVAPERSFPDAKGLERSYYLEAFNDAHAFPKSDPNLPANMSGAFTLDRDLVVGEFEEEATSSFRLVFAVSSVPWSVWPHVPFTLGKPGTTKDFEIARIDVDDVELTLPDGSTVKRPGRYTVEAKQENGLFAPYLGLRTNFPTKTGLDVPPGTYRINTTYPTTGGGAGTDTAIVTVP